MNTNSLSSWLIAIATAIAGILLIVWHKEADLFSWLIRALGFLLAIPGAYILVSSLGTIRRNRIRGVTRETVITDGHKTTTAIRFRGRAIAWSLIIVSTATILLGFWMLVNPTFFVGLVSYLFAAILILCGLFQFIDVVYMSRPVSMPLYFYIMPVLLVIAGIVILSTKISTIDDMVTLITGILLVLYSINGIARMIVYSRYMKALSRTDATDSRQ
ncbi:MAG: DUF308 domain-containing protein [Muribaculaceae bacterium]|nr:DUF308 domain-containing protein [Muribaculaceae bacterium]